MSDIINNIEKYQKGWSSGQPETPCGHGSKLSETGKQREWIPKIIADYDIKAIADIGAGDMNWIRHMSFIGDVDYKPYDLVPRHPEVQYFDLLNQIPPKVDLIMCLWVLNHFPYADAQLALDNIKKSGSKYLLTTDRPRWHDMQPPEIVLLDPIEKLLLNHKNDSIMLVQLG